MGLAASTWLRGALGTWPRHGTGSAGTRPTRIRGASWADHRIPEGSLISTGEFDSVDGYSGTFQLAALKTWRATDDLHQLRTLLPGITGAVSAIEVCQDSDRLAWAMPSWRVKYLMGQAEGYAGLRAAAGMAQAVGDDALPPAPRGRLSASRRASKRCGTRRLTHTTAPCTATEHEHRRNGSCCTRTPCSRHGWWPSSSLVVSGPGCCCAGSPRATRLGISPPPPTASPPAPSRPIIGYRRLGLCTGEPGGHCPVGRTTDPDRWAASATHLALQAFRCRAADDARTAYPLRCGATGSGWAARRGAAPSAGKDAAVAQRDGHDHPDVAKGAAGAGAGGTRGGQQGGARSTADGHHVCRAQHAGHLS